LGKGRVAGTLPLIESFTSHHLTKGALMVKTKLLIGALAIAGLIGSPLAADAKSKKHVKHHSSMTTGANMKSGTSMKSTRSPAANPSSQGNVGPGTSNVSGPQPGGR
jgi:hypothetical protein